MSKVFKFTTTVDFYIRVPDDVMADDAREFCTENLRQREAFLGVADDDKRVIDVFVQEERICTASYQKTA